ncbi:hypothetical protein GDO86_012328 [Hymenochirus boettgeri]|uniref:Synembryn n=1 Tax=Hymenochirus boettgeri TaxID=247094 RepID=A0A8T2IUS2_9PIPI|nr:hypothetical protein GDO86_012328 [Hymenochirus boettgeri]
MVDMFVFSLSISISTSPLRCFQFRKKKFRDWVPKSDSDYDSDYSEEQNVRLLACLETIRILSRDKHALSPFTSRSAMQTLSQYAGLDYSEEMEVPLIPDSEKDAALYRHLAAILRHCLLRQSDGEDRTEEFHGLTDGFFLPYIAHTVNLLVNLPTHVPRCPSDTQSRTRLGGVYGHEHGYGEVLLQFLDRRLDRFLNLLTESSRVHRETRKFLRAKVLPPLRDVKTVLNGQHIAFPVCEIHRYGNAAGCAGCTGLLAGGRGEGRYSEDEDTDTEEYREAKAKRKTTQPYGRNDEEQKEYEAMKLVSMFDSCPDHPPMWVTSDGRLEPLDEAAQRCYSSRNLQYRV